MTRKALWRQGRTWPLVLVPPAVVLGVFYGWPLAVGVVWFGASFIVLVLVLDSFRRDIAGRFPDREGLARADANAEAPAAHEHRPLDDA